MAGLDIARLHASTPRGQATLIRQYLASPGADIDGFTTELIGAIASGSIIPIYVTQTWLSLTKSPSAVAALLRQSHSVSARQMAIKYFKVRLCDPHTSEAMREAIGGAPGVADIISGLSEVEARQLIAALAQTVSKGDQAQRRSFMVELHNILMDASQIHESRDLRLTYASLAPACDEDIARMWFDRAIMAKPSFPGWNGSENAQCALQKLRDELCLHHNDLCKERVLSAFSDKKIKTDIAKPLELFISQDFNFALRLLAAIESRNSMEGIDKRWVTGQLLSRLAWHVSKVSVEKEAHVKTWERIITLIEKHPDIRSDFGKDFSYNGSRRGLCYFAIKSWEQSALKGQEPNDRLERLLSFFQGTGPSPVDVPPILHLVRSELRWNLLRLFLRQSSRDKFDIEHESDPKSLQGLFPGIMSVYCALPPKEGLALFERMLSAHGDYRFLLSRQEQTDNHAWTNIQYPNQSADGHKFRAHLIRRLQTSGESSASTLVPDTQSVLQSLRETEVPYRQKQAHDARDAGRRSWWAVAAIDLAIEIAGAVGDMDYYHDMIIWARRFLKDHFTVNDLFSTSCPFKTGAKDILGVLPLAPAPVPDLENKLRGANKVILDLFQTSIMATREPSFQPYYWTRTHGICGIVVRARLDRVRNIRESYGWDDDRLYSVVLKPTLNVLIEAERMLLYNEKFCLDAEGLLEEWKPSRQFSQLQLRFLDELARARNDLWQERRQQEYPHLQTAGVGWPKGLPLQSLIPRGFFGRPDMPYIKQRIESALFCDSEFALSPAPKKDGDESIAVGGFVDNWRKALELYLSGTQTKTEKRALIRKVWDYALGPLTGDRMRPKEAQKFWREQFEHVTSLPGDLWRLGPSKDDKLIPDLPVVEDPNSPTIWDPRPNGGEEDDYRNITLDIVNLDVMLNNPIPYSKIGGKMDRPRGYEFQPFFSSGTLGVRQCLDRRDRGQIRGTSIDALWAVDLLSGNGSQLLSERFPPSGILRLPALSLDQRFVDDHRKFKGVSSSLCEQDRMIPPQLLLRLAESLLHHVLEEQDQGKRRIGEFVLSVESIRKGDRPDHAVDLIARFIKQIPEGSAWHRELLSHGTLKTLSPKALEMLFASMSDIIIGGLIQSKQDDGGESAQKGPRVKITTAKMLPQLLQDSRFVGGDFAISTIEKLISSSAHIDIRNAAVSTLISSAAEESQRSRALAALRAHAVPAAAAMNERKPETEEDWAIAEEDPSKPLPTLPDDDDASRPILNLLVQGRNACDAHKEVLEIAFEALRLSGENNRRWILLFIKKHGLDVPSDMIPPIPTQPKVYVRALMKLSAKDVIRQDFETVTQYVKLMATTPGPLAAAIKRIHADKALFDTRDAHHFLDMFYLSGSYKALNMGGNWALGLISDLKNAIKKVDRPNITLDEVYQFAYELADAFIMKGEEGALQSTINSITTSLEEEGHEDPSNKLVRRILSRVDELRTEEWQNNPSREPRSLPNTFPLKVKALGHATPEQARRFPLMKSLARSLIALMEELVASQIPYHENLDWLTQFYRRRAVCLPLALLIGRPTTKLRKPMLLDHLRMQLALRLLKNAGFRDEKRKKLLDAAVVMMKDWDASPVEEYRRQTNANKQTEKDLKDRIKKMNDEKSCDEWPEPEGDWGWE